MNKVKVGRNDPCPCGSGKKYKKCCAVLEEMIDTSSDLFTRYNYLMSAVKIKLDNYFESGIKKIRNEAKERFLRFSADDTVPEQNESIFSDWLWFDKADSQGNTLGYHYLKDNGQYMEDNLKECLSALIMSHLSVYEVQGVENNSLLIDDIFSGKQEKVLLKEPWELDNNEKDFLLLGRLVRLKEANIFSGMVLLMENSDERKNFILKHMEYLQEIQQEELSYLLKFKGEILYGIFDHALKKILVNLHDVRFLDINNTERTQILTELSNNNKPFDLVHNTSGIQWFKPEGENRGYVRIGIADEYLVACADVLEDITLINDTITSILPEKELTVVSSYYLQRPPLMELADIWFTVIKDQETERWLDIPHNELDNKTPRELLAEENGREKLLNILNDLNNSIATDEQKELLEYMKLRID